MGFTYFIGVDVSKNTLDFAVYKSKELSFHRRMPNNQKQIGRFVEELKAMDGFSLLTAVFCMEYIGIYNNPLLVYLTEKKGNIWLEAASHIKQSLGNIRGKDDKIDAKRIGKFAYKNQDELRLWTPKKESIDRLAHLTALRDRLIRAKKMLVAPIKEMESFAPKSTFNRNKKLCQRSLNSLLADIDKVDKAIREIIDNDPVLARLFENITSVQGVGKETAINMIITTNGFEDIKDPKKFACYAGVAPFPKQSGLFKGRNQVSHMANKKMKTLLHMAALSAISYNTDLKHYYQRKVEEGKNKMSVINAVRNKLVHRIFACVKQNRNYEISYAKKLV